MKTKFHALMTSVVATAALLGAVSLASAAEQWFVLGEQTLKTADPSTEIVAEGSRWDKDVKQVKISAEGADVQVTEVVLHWANRRDDKISDVGTLKSGGETAPKNAPGYKARLKSITITYKILGGAPTATLKVWGYD